MVVVLFSMSLQGTQGYGQQEDHDAQPHSVEALEKTDCHLIICAIINKLIGNAGIVIWKLSVTRNRKRNLESERVRYT